MLKKLLTGCLTIVAAAALAVPAMAAEMSGKVGGRAVADLVSKSSTPSGGDALSYTDMFAQGRIDYTLTATEGDWKATGKVEYRSSYSHDAGKSPTVLQKFVKFENEAVSFALGTQWWGIVYLTPYIGVSDSFDRYGYGIYGGSASYLRDDRLIVGIKQVGLQIQYSTKNMDTADSTSDGLAQTMFGAQYDGTFGPLTIAAAYNSVTKAAIENIVGDTAKDTAGDGFAATELALAVRYAVMEGMFVEVDYESFATKNGTSGADTYTQNTMGLAFAMALSEVQGFAVSYDQSTSNSGASGADDTVYTLLTATFNQKIAGQQLYFGYNSSSTKAGDADAAVAATIALGGRVSF